MRQSHKVRPRFWFALLLLVSTAAAATPDGRALYTRYCAACHGRDGHGGVGVPLALPDFLATADDAYLRTTLRIGRPGRVMPAFPRLNDAQVNAIVGYIGHWRPATPAPLLAVSRGNIVHGKQLYARYCAACHGARGEGGHGTGVTFSRPRDYPILAPALNNPGFLAAASDAMIKTTLARGRAGTPMVSFLSKGLSGTDLDDLVAYVRSFGDNPPPAALPEHEAPVIVRVSPYSVRETVEKLQTAFNAANMRVVRVAPFDLGFVPAGKEDTRQYIVDACDFGFVNEALKVDPRVGLFLPCRVVVAEDHGKVKVMSVNPKRLSVIFNNAELNALCARMKKTYINVIEEAVF